MKRAVCVEMLPPIAQEIRKDVVRMSSVARSGGVDVALSLVDVIVYLYWSFLNVNPKEPNMPERDRFILGEMEGCPALYAALARCGFFDREQLWCYRRLGAILQGTLDIKTPGVDAPATTHGFSVGIGVGMAWELLSKGLPGRVVCLLNARQLFEDAVLRALHSACALKLGGMIFIFAANDFDEIMSSSAPSSLLKNITELGITPVSLDGHNFAALEEAFNSADLEPSRPKIFFLHTRLGKGLPFIESGGNGYKGMLTMSEADMALSLLEVENANEG